MVPLEAFPHKLNEIFSEYNAASSIVISYISLSDDKTSPENQCLKLTGVNGFKTLTAFTQYLAGIQASLVVKLNGAQSDIEPNIRALFLKQAINRCNRLALITSPFVAAVQGGTDSKQTDTTGWGFRHPLIIHDHGQPRDEPARQELIRLTHRYAHTWLLYTRQLKEQLQCFIFINNYLPLICNPLPGIPPGEKITIRSTVPELAAFARLFFENHAVTLTNKTQFCRLIANMFSTPKQKDISEGSLRNHFDSPTPETIEHICEELRKMMNNSQKLKKVF